MTPRRSPGSVVTSAKAAGHSAALPPWPASSASVPLAPALPNAALPAGCEYVWLDANQEARSKTKIYPGKNEISSIVELSVWNFDGSSTGQAPGEDSEVCIVPRSLYLDPFRGPPHLIVLCDCCAPTGEPLPSNTRALAVAAFAYLPETEPWFGLEQEYVLFKDGHPLGWPSSKARHGQKGGPAVTLGFPGEQGPYYCSDGADVAFGREIIDEHLRICTTAGLQVSGINAEVMPGQWEFQVGPCVGVEAADELVLARYLLSRVCERFGVVVCLAPKPVVGFNGSGCHTNFSTKAMREDADGLSSIITAIEKLGKRHNAHIANYGADNDQRLTGRNETAAIDKFSWGVANRGASVRVGNDTAIKGKGYFEDRRPAANMDPYLVTGMIYDTCVLDAKLAGQWPAPPADGGLVRRRSSLGQTIGKAVGDFRSSLGKVTGGRGKSKERPLSARFPPANTGIPDPEVSSVEAGSEGDEPAGVAIPTSGKGDKAVTKTKKKAGCAVVM